MHMERITVGVMACFSALAYAQPAPTSAPVPQFEVASVRPSAPDATNRGSGGHTGSGRVLMTNSTLKRLIMGAYGVGQNEIIGGPDWLDQDKFDIQAKADQSTDGDTLMKMQQALLADRFKLAIRRENKTIPVYVLGIAKNGPKLEKSESGESSSGNGRGHLEGRNIDMAGLAWRLGRQLDRPVVDRTELPGAFNYKLEWTPEDELAKRSTQPGAALPDLPSIFVAIQQQLGLKLEPQKAPVEVLVIDHAQKPTEN
jgi:uncharacterized protein (TIGR03435 family)